MSKWGKEIVKMNGFDNENCGEILSELILEEGEIVYSLHWDSGGPDDLACTKRIVINGEDWVVTPEGQFMKKSIRKRKGSKVVRIYE
jgi:hypothetical protein